MAELFPESKILLFPGLPQSILRRACEHAEPGEEKTEVSDSCDIHLYLEQRVGKAVKSIPVWPCANPDCSSLLPAAHRSVLTSQSPALQVLHL